MQIIANSLCACDLDTGTQKNKRLLHLDVLRLVAICLVIFNHTGERGFLLFANCVGSVMYYPYMLMSVFCKVAVPIFFMISGALLLPKQESIGRLFSQRILRIVVVLVLISVPYYLWLHRSQGLSLVRFLTFIYGNSASTSLWYLYSYVALLLIMPFLRCMVKSMQEQHFRYLIAGYILFFGLIPSLEYCLWKGNLTSHESFAPVLFQTPNIFYALTGYYLEHVAVCRRNRKNEIFQGIILSIIALTATCLLTHYQMVAAGHQDAHQLEYFFNCFICIPAMTLYNLVKYLGKNIKSAKQEKLLTFLGSAVFGIYLIEKFCRTLTGSLYSVLAPAVGSFCASLIWVFATFCLSLALVTFAKNAPVIKKVVNKFI